MLEIQARHHLPVVLLVWRAGIASQAAVSNIARRAAEGKAKSISASAVKRRANTHGRTQPEAPLPRSSRSRLPLPIQRNGPVAVSAGGDGSVSKPRGMSHWSALRSRLFPALRLAALPVTAACLAAAAGTQRSVKTPGGKPSPTPPLAPFATHGSGFPESTPPADVRTARQMLESRGFVHPGMQPGASWGALPAGSPKEEVHPMFEYILLFPA